MYTESYCDNYFMKFISLSPTYVWGANISCLNDSKDPHATMMKLYDAYGTDTGKYNQAYYENKYKQAMAGSGWISDCSGFFRELSPVDRTAQGYYNACVAVGSINTIDLNHSCLVFRGTATKINHVGYYNASNKQVQEMANSDTNFQSKAFNAKNWTYWGKPDFMDYSSVPSVIKPYLYKGIDISSYQKNVNYSALKKAGIDFAILKIMNKQRQIDSMFTTHSTGMDSAGIKVYGVYNYSYATSVDSAKYDAAMVVKYLNGRKCAVFMDVEDNCQKNLGQTLIDMINAYQSVIEANGLPFCLYTGLSFYNTYIKPYVGSMNCKQLWIARYYNGYNPMPFSEDPNQAYKPIEGINAWQYTSSGVVSGIDTKIDLNIIYKDVTLSVPTVASPEPQIRPVIKNTVKTTGANLNVRNKPNTQGKVIGRLANGQNVIIFGVDKNTGWYRLSVTDEKWCSNAYVESACKGRITVQNSVYIRSADSKAGEIWGFYKNGEIVKILHQSTNTGWYLTERGWVSNKYITII